MSFTEFIKEGANRNDDLDPSGIIKFLETIKLECKPFLKEGTSLYRGMPQAHAIGYAGSKTVRVNRRPKDSGRIENDVYDIIAKDLKLPNRSSILFGTTDIEQSSEFGFPFFIFPKGNFKYYYFKNIKDIVDQFPSGLLHVLKSEDINGISTCSELMDIFKSKLEVMYAKNKLPSMRNQLDEYYHDTKDFFEKRLKELETTGMKNTKNEIMIHDVKEYYYFDTALINKINGLKHFHKVEYNTIVKLLKDLHIDHNKRYE
jgi:hypothetical protein